MKLSLKTRYGFLAMGYIAAHQEDGEVGAEAIARAYHIPRYSVLKVLEQLVKGGVVRSKRGPHGGFVLNKKAEEITLIEIIDAVIGLVPDAIDIAEQTKNEHFAVRMQAAINAAGAEERKVLEKRTLAEIIGSRKSK
jgi:Rrf2 family protein